MVLVLLVMLAGVTHAFFPATETKCDATQNTSTCSVTLGGSVYIQLLASARGLRLQWRKDLPTGPVNVFSVKRDRVQFIQEDWRNRTDFFFGNGTFKISNVEKADSGQYIIDVFQQDGVRLHTKHVKLDIQGKGLPREPQPFFPATETNCDATQNTSTCSVTLGGSVYIQLMASASGLRLQCKKDLPTGSVNVFSVKRDRVQFIQEDWRNRTDFFFGNGTFKISNVEKADSGQYIIDVFQQDGVRLHTKHVKLDVQENTFPTMVIIVSAGAGGGLLLIVTCCIFIISRRNRRPEERGVSGVKS